MSKSTDMMGKPVWWDDAIVFLESDEIIGPVVSKYNQEYLSARQFPLMIKSLYAPYVIHSGMGSSTLMAIG